MNEIVSGELQPIAYSFNDEEAQTISFALGFFALQIRNGNYPVEEGKELVARQAIHNAGVLQTEIEKGSRVLSEEASRIVFGTHLNYLWRMHARMSDRNYEMYCRFLGVSPNDLKTNAIAAYRIMQGYETEIEFIAA